MATALAGPVARRGPALRSVYDFVPDGLIRGVFFRALLLAAPIQSVLLTSVQGTTPAFILALFSPFLLVAKDRRYGRLLAFLAGFVLLYALYMALSLSGYLIDEPDMSRLTVIREAFVYGQLRQTHLTQGVYLLTSLLFAFLVYAYWQEAFLKFIYFAILLLATYGFFEFMFFAVFHTNGDFLSNRNFGDLDTAAAGAGRNLSVTGSRLQTSNLFGEGYMRLKSLTAEPSMYSLSVTPFTVYAFGRRWWWIFTVLMTSLVLSTSSTAVIGLLAGLGWIETRRRPEAVLYLTGAVVTVALLYATAEPVQRVLDVLLFEKLDTVSGNERINYFTAHAVVPFDGNPIRALFGLGFGTVRSGDMLSNLLANVGLVGLMGYATLLLAPCFLLRKSQDRLSIVASLLAIFAMEMLTVPEFNYLPPWFMVAMAYARVREQRRAGGAPAA